MRILLITDTTKSTNQEIFQADLIIQLWLDGTYTVLKNRYGPSGIKCKYNELERLQDKTTDDILITDFLKINNLFLKNN